MKIITNFVKFKKVFEQTFSIRRERLEEVFKVFPFFSLRHQEVFDVESRKLIKYYCKDIDIDNLLMNLEKRRGRRQKTLAGYSPVFITNANDSGNFLYAEEPNLW